MNADKPSGNQIRKHSSRLAAKVAAYNHAHFEANRLQRLFIEALRPFVGKKVLVTGGLAHKVKEVLAKLDNSNVDFKDRGFHLWRNTNSNYSLSWSLRCDEYVEGKAGHLSAEATFYVGDLMRNPNCFRITPILEKVLEPETLPTNYTEEGIRMARKKVEETKQAYDVAKSWNNLGPFGIHDNF